MIEELLGKQNFSKGDSKTITEEIERYITSTKHKFQKSFSLILILILFIYLFIYLMNF